MSDQNPTDTDETSSDPLTEDNVTADVPDIPDDVPRPDPSKDQG
jgi:hypothetical protein